jgi:hypothetical protein
MKGMVLTTLWTLIVESPTITPEELMPKGTLALTPEIGVIAESLPLEYKKSGVPRSDRYR